MSKYLIPMVRKDGRGVKLYTQIDAANEAEAMDLAEEQVNSPDTPEGDRYVALTWEKLPDAFTQGAPDADTGSFGNDAR